MTVNLDPWFFAVSVKRRYEIEGDIAEGTYVRKRDQIIRYIEPYYGSLAANELTQDYVDA